jgi:hypothetical protein
MYVTRATDGMTASYVSHRVMPVIEESLPHRVLQSLVNIALTLEIAVCGCSKQTTTCGELPKVINTDHHQKPACAGCIGLSLRPRPHAVVEHSKSRRPQLPRVGAVSLIFGFGPFKVLVEGDHAMATVDGRWRRWLVAAAVAIVGVVMSGQHSHPRPVGQCLNGDYVFWEIQVLLPHMHSNM